jgi:phenylacetic acid degradation operon negative regulatory protein
MCPAKQKPFPACSLFVSSAQRRSPVAPEVVKATNHGLYNATRLRTGAETNATILLTTVTGFVVMGIMKARTELLLYRLGWLAGMMMRPSWRTMDSSFESWAYGSGLLRQIQRLEYQAYLETRRDPESGERVIRLTAKGAALCRLGSDPEARWGREWDGKWRWVIFDIPESDRTLRARIRRRLCKEGFGCLQQSVWITPDPFGSMIEELRGAAVNGSSLTLMEGVPMAGETSGDLVRSAWDFHAIYQAWSALSAHLDSVTNASLVQHDAHLVPWLAKEMRLVQGLQRIDPLLPGALLPKDYPGRKIWKTRGKIMERLAARTG